MLKRHLTYANVMATLGVFLALGGVSYAAISIPKNAIGAKQIKTGAVTSSEVKNRSLKAGDFARGQLPQGERGPAGPAAAKFWAQIRGGANTTVGANSGGVTATFVAANSARQVTFPGDVSKCSIQLTQVGGLPGRTVRVINQPTGSTVDVWTSFVNGGQTTTTTDSFDIAVLC